jgi:hypothetical protein
LNATRRSRLTFVALLLLLIVSAAFAEAGLQLITRVSARAEDVLGPDISGLVPDAVLDFRGNPRYPEHDAAGYRNRERPVHAPIVVLGDSQAYGVSVRRDEAWPYLAQASTGRRVYSMALPGYCPTHNVLQFDEALSFHTVPVMQIEQWTDGPAVSPEEVFKRKRVKQLLGGEHS